MNRYNGLPSWVPDWRTDERANGGYITKYLVDSKSLNEDHTANTYIVRMERGESTLTGNEHTRKLGA